MATITLTTTPQAVGDGTKMVVCEPAQGVVFGFGATAPSEWIKMHMTTSPYTFSTAAGKVWMRTESVDSVELTYFEGV